MSIETRRFSGNDAHPYIKDLARLRIEVFREFPYLYAGSPAYESDYLRTYLGVPDSVVVIALDGGHVVGVSTGLPLVAETDNVRIRSAAGVSWQGPGRAFLRGTRSACALVRAL